MSFTDLACCTGGLGAVGVRGDISALKWDGACTDGAYADRACPDRACVDGACADRAYVDKACADGAYLDGAYTDRACSYPLLEFP